VCLASAGFTFAGCQDTTPPEELEAAEGSEFDEGDEPLAEGNDLEVIVAALTAEESIEVMVTLDASDALAGTSVAHPTALVEPIADLLEPIFSEVLSSLPDGEFERFRVYRNFPTLALRLHTLNALEVLLEHPRTQAVFENAWMTSSLDQSLALIGQPAAAGGGHLGAGTSVAVLDTGLDYTRAAFGSCTSPGQPSGCRVVASVDFAPNDGVLDRGNFHGTNVAGIVAGVAPGASLVGLDVFTGDSGSSADIAAAVDWVIDNRATYNIAAMNLSLGSGSYTARCSNSLEPALSTARSQGVLAAIATGNNGYKSSIAQPACAPSAVAVGAVYDANLGGMNWGVCNDATTAVDKATCFSNSASFIDVLAPGAMITAAGLTMGGTSQASPHVAGAIAVLRTSFPEETTARTLERLKAGGTNVTDSRNGVTKPRISLPGAITAPTGPSGTVSIANDATYTRNSTVTLSLTASGNPNKMCVSNGTTCSTWINYAATKSWTLATGNGTRSVYVKFRNAQGLVSPQVSDNIVRDGLAANNGTLSVTPSDGQVALTWSGQTDAHSGVSSYKLVYAASGTPPTNCNGGSVAYAGTDTSASVSSLINGQTYAFRLCTIDVAGNVSTGVTAITRPAPEFDPPTGSVVINSNDTYTRPRAVTLAISGSDDSGVTKMCVSNGATCTIWVNFATTLNWTLADVTGNKTVRVWFRDAYNNTSGAVLDTIILDKTAPSNGTLNGTRGTESVSLSWSGQSDAHSGLASYKVVYARSSTAPANCGVGSVAYTGTDRTHVQSGLLADTVYSFRLCAIDTLGNTSAGVIRSVRTLP